MKQVKSSWRAAAACVLVLAAADLGAQEQEAVTLTRAQWLKKVGASVSDPGVLRETMAQLAPEDKAEFAQRVVKAATRLPVSPEEKSAALVKTAVACIAGTNGGAKRQVIAEVFAGVPVEHLPVVAEELAKRFDQEYNKLSDEEYGKIAEETLDAAVKRNADTDAPSVRNTFVILAFLRGAKDPALQGRLISRLPDERMRNLAASWLPPALKDRNYDALLAAADADDLQIRNDVLLRLVGHANMDRLLADLNANQGIRPATWVDETGTNEVQTVWIPLSQARIVSGITADTATMGMLNHAPDYGINRVPLRYPQGYQNQTISCGCPPRGSGSGNGNTPP
jgi:hypothetical protein